MACNAAANLFLTAGGRIGLQVIAKHSPYILFAAKKGQ